MKIIIAGDLFISDQFRDQTLIDKSIENIFQRADYRIVNLEAPIANESSNNKIIKTGPYLRMSEEIIMPFLNQLKVDYVTMANNHILDYGIKGLLDTFDSLKKNNITYVGAGKNILDASKILILEKDGLRIAILNFCETEWSIAEVDRSGANPLDIIDNTKQIKEAKQQADYVLVVIHGGHEYYNLPSPRMQKQYRFYADQGADIVIGHHTHCISGYELYNGVPIYYSLGNFLFTKISKNNEWYTGLILEIEVTNEILSSKLYPVRQQKDNFQLKLLNGDKKDEVYDQIKTYSEIITDNMKLKEKWNNYIKKQSNIYLNYWSPLSFVNNRYISKVLRKIFGNMLNKRGVSLYVNLMRCEAHRDLSIGVLKKYLER